MTATISRADPTPGALCPDELEPERILVAGDWHGNTAWGLGVIALLDTLLPAEPQKLILQCGDFGIWPGRGGARYVAELNLDLKRANALLWFVDGNHEDFTELKLLAHNLPPTNPIRVHTNITWLPRGHRWNWWGRTWLAVGGGVSVDRAYRREGVDWWPDEEITAEQETRILRGGGADVMVCHDAPASVPLRLGQPGIGWAAEDLVRSELHRERLQGITDIVQPRHIFHGHYHYAHDTDVTMPHGTVSVMGLDRDDSLIGNYRVVNVRDMTSTPAPRIVSYREP